MPQKKEKLILKKKRSINKYNIYKNIFYSFNWFPTRLLNLKKEKWLKLSTKLKKKIFFYEKKRKFLYKKRKKYKKKKGKKRKFFFLKKKKKKKNRRWLKEPAIVRNIFFKKVKKGRFLNVFKKAIIPWYAAHKWLRLKQIKKRSLNLRKLLQIIFGKTLKKTKIKMDLKKNKNYFKKSTSVLVKPYFRQDVLLWLLNFFSSAKNAQNFKRTGNVLINKKNTKNSLIFAGDTAELKNHRFKLKALRKKYFKGKKFFTFLIVDYYINSLVIVKNFEELGHQDFPLITQESINIKRLGYKL